MSTIIRDYENYESKSFVRIKNREKSEEELTRKYGKYGRDKRNKRNKKSTKYK